MGLLKPDQVRPLPQWLWGWAQHHGHNADRLAREIERRERQRMKHETGWRYWVWLYHRLTFKAVFAACHVYGRA